MQHQTQSNDLAPQSELELPSRRIFIVQLLPLYLLVCLLASCKERVADREEVSAEAPTQLEPTVLLEELSIEGPHTEKQVRARTSRSEAALQDCLGHLKRSEATLAVELVVGPRGVVEGAVVEDLGALVGDEQTGAENQNSGVDEELPVVTRHDEETTSDGSDDGLCGCVSRVFRKVMFPPHRSRKGSTIHFRLVLRQPQDEP